MATHILFESAGGYVLFKRKQGDDIGKRIESVTHSMSNFSSFSQLVQFQSFAPFESATHALENATSISEGVLHEFLKTFLELNLRGQKNIKLGVSEPKLGSAIQEATSIPVITDDLVQETLRGIRLHLTSFIKELSENDLLKTQLGLGHSYSRSKVKFNVNKVDNMIIQSIALLDQLDKDINTFAMRVREWYSWHFPELGKLVNDNYTYARLVQAIRLKSSLSKDSIPQLAQILSDDQEKAEEILKAADSSMGTDISEIDLTNIIAFANRVVQLSDYRQRLHTYLTSKMHTVAPNLSSLIGELVGARLISRAGSLTNLAKAPASTIQILGAEKALFRALKARSNTPKYGLIYHSSFIGRAGTKNKGRISRYLANKCAIASRIDSFSEIPTTVFGEKLKQQVEDRLKFYETGQVPRKNQDVMHEALQEVLSSPEVTAAAATTTTKGKKRTATEAIAKTPQEEEPSKKKAKKEKKEEKKQVEEKVEEEEEEDSMEVDEQEIKEKKKKEKQEKKERKEQKKKEKQEKKDKKKEKKAKKSKKEAASDE